MKANYKGTNAIIKKDEWDFTMANFNSLVPFGYKSFAFPRNCNQVFFLNNEDDLGWKVVLRTEVRGRRIDNEIEEEEESEIFRMEANNDFGGLPTACDRSKVDQEPLWTGKNVNINNILAEGVDEASMFFD